MCNKLKDRLELDYFIQNDIVAIRIEQLIDGR